MSRIEGQGPSSMRDVRVAVVGCGAWGKNLVRNFAELGALEALVDNHPSRVDALIAQHGGRALSYDAALADPAIEAVAIAAPAVAHHALAKRALEAGKHVFVEKPLALEEGEARELCRLAERFDRRLMVGHLLQYHPVFDELKRLVRDGGLGRLQYVYSNRLNLGKIRSEEDVVWSFAPHDVSMILSLVGSEPERVQAAGGCYVNGSILDVTTIQLAFPGGEHAQIFVSWLHPFKEQKLVAVGSEGMAVFDDGEIWERKLVLYPHKVEWRDDGPVPTKADGVPIAVPVGEPLRLECLHFLDCIRTGATPRTDGREGLRVFSVLARASECLREARAGSRPTARSAKRSQVAGIVTA